MRSVDQFDALRLLRAAEGKHDAQFRRGQWEAIDAIVNRRERLLLVQRTGWGKSSVYFIATRVLRNSGRGPTLIISPLLSLIRNQTLTANRYDVRALSINSSNIDDWSYLEKEILDGKVDAILVAPERLANENFIENILRPLAGSLGLFVVDEAHCISDWGHDFRPDYKRIGNILQEMPANVPILGTTATANRRVTEDVQRQLGNITIQRGTLVRESLGLQTLRLPSQASRLAWLIDNIESLPGTGVIYALTKRDTEQIANWLRKEGISAVAYHSGVSSGDRKHFEEQLLHNKIKALVATVALGMGYDKPDLGFVVHFQAPSSIVAYYQQVGRAGRGIDRAVGILMAGHEDEEIHDYFRRSAFPQEKWVATIIEALEESDGMTRSELGRAVNLRWSQIDQVLKYLSVLVPSPVVKLESKWYRTVIDYRMDHESIQRLAQKREVEWKEVQQYMDHSGCLMEFLVDALDGDGRQPCGKCSYCLGQPVVPEEISTRTEGRVQRFLRRAEFPLECKKKVPRDSLPLYGFSGHLPNELRPQMGRILSRWGDAGWGRRVLAGKNQGYFGDELVDAAVDMYNRWQPDPTPKWVTCIPSLLNPDLVPNYAVRLSEALGLPFRSTVKKVKSNDPQKLQHNGFHQCKNLDGVFAIEHPFPDSPVLLVDDVYDSGWTLTIVSALLLRKGSGPVWPLALATAGIGV